MLKLISTLFSFYGILYLLLSHSAILTCRYGQNHLSSVHQKYVNGRNEQYGFHWQQIDSKFMEKCPQKFPRIVFSLSDYILDKHPSFSGVIAQYTNDFLSGLTSMHDFILLSGILLTIAENLVFQQEIEFIRFQIIEIVTT
ncbi:UNKNOWN [Stylonychia lemnae]|uniref:Uncharacterized protein n=1 Tax=Stylonychia lemnae TaxID=5949 RepID=A0A078ABX9_STYLE|nr:UNKNOWN [Stylonychia lemnae]|eukprot:CDW79800.1 UNKNOWN [Stylonychia lemnae]